jgi:hypothetical protein
MKPPSSKLGCKGKASRLMYSVKEQEYLKKIVQNKHQTINEFCRFA